MQRNQHRIHLASKARQFSVLVGQSVVNPVHGETRHVVTPRPGELGLTFIGHSSFLMQMQGRTLVVDPNFARWLVVLKRQRKPGIALRDLPAVDVVLLTHAHMDHLHKPSLRRIVQQAIAKTGVAPIAITPLHVGDLVAEMGFREVRELDWWQSSNVLGMEIVHTPARHWGARMVSDTHRGFGGYVVRAGEHSIYHAGDTAYFPGFREIGERLRPEIALLPIGAYSPEHFRNVHASPEDSLRGFQEMGSRWMVPMHYGTFRLSHEPMEEPVPRLLVAAHQAGVRDQVRVLQEGVTKFFTPESSEASEALRRAGNHR